MSAFYHAVDMVYAELSLISGVDCARMVFPKAMLELELGVLVPLTLSSNEGIELLLLVLVVLEYFLNGSSGGLADLSLVPIDSELRVKGFEGESLKISLFCMSSAKNLVLAASSWLRLVALGTTTSGLGGGNFDTGREL